MAGARVLVVDDEPIICELFEEELRYQGFQPSVAHSGDAAWKLLQDQSFDALLVDIRMPGMTGVELLARVRERHGTMPAFFLMTGFADVTMEQVLAQGANGLFGKPFDPLTALPLLRKSLEPPARRWTGPAQLSEARLTAKFASLPEARSTRRFLLGRGGFFCALERSFPAVGERVRFAVEFGAEALRLEGEGIVRWRLRPDAHRTGGVGLEFDLVDEASLPHLLGLVANLEGPAFIPSHRETSLLFPPT